MTELAEMEARPWPDFSRGKPITQAALARLLKTLNVKPMTPGAGSYKTKRQAKAADRSRSYSLAMLERVFASYLATLPRGKLV